MSFGVGPWVWVLFISLLLLFQLWSTQYGILSGSFYSTLGIYRSLFGNFLPRAGHQLWTLMVPMEPQQESGSFLSMGYREFDHSSPCVRCNSSLQTREVPMVIMPVWVLRQRRSCSRFDTALINNGTLNYWLWKQERLIFSA